MQVTFQPVHYTRCMRYLGGHLWCVRIPVHKHEFCHSLYYGIVYCGVRNVIFINSLRPSDAYMRQWTNQHWFRQWLVAWSTPSHYQNQCWNIVNKTLRNKLQWNVNRNSNIFIQENWFESVVCEMLAILSRPQYVNIFFGSYETAWT